MATPAARSVLSSLSSPTPSYVNQRGVHLNSFCLFHTKNTFPAQTRKYGSCQRRSMSLSAKSLDRIPKQFREENLKDGVAENYKSISKHFYGLTPSQMDMFIGEDNPVRRQSGRVTEENISSAWNYLNHGGVWSLSGVKGKTASALGMSVCFYRSGADGPMKLEEPPPDLPSILLDARIVYLGLPIVPQVTELIVAQFMWLDFDDPTKPVYLYINSSGTQNNKMESVGSETDAYAIADTMSYCKAKVYTINVGMAFGQAAMILSVGEKGYRAVQPHASTKLYLPKMNRSTGTVSDAWIKAREMDANTDSYLDLLSKGTGKSKEELAEDIKRPKYFLGEEAVAYGLADKVADSDDAAFERRDYGGKIADPKAMKAPQSGHGQHPESESGHR